MSPKELIREESDTKNLVSFDTTIYRSSIKTDYL